MLHPIKVTKYVKKYHVLTPELWLVKAPPDTEEVLNLQWKKHRISVNKGGTFLLLINDVYITVLNKNIYLQSVNFDILSKFIAFIDEAREVKIFSASVPRWTVFPVQDMEIWQDSERLKGWFLSQMVEMEPALSPFLNLLRSTENYRLVRYLLAQSGNGHSLYELSERYGTSYSHFRRLCRSALGDSVKKELCNWRMARALLDIIYGKKNFTEVAFTHGYSSLAHFSNDVKKRLTMSPQQLFNLIHLDTE